MMTFSPLRYKRSRKHNPPFEGKCFIVPQSGLRKRMRAARRAPVLLPSAREVARHIHPRQMRELLA